MVAGFSGVMTLDRTEFGMKYGEGGIGSNVTIRVESVFSDYPERILAI